MTVPSGPGVAIGSRSGRRRTSTSHTASVSDTRERADREDEPAARPQQVRRRRGDRDLARGEAREPVPRHPPQQLGTATRGADPAARRVHEHAVEARRLGAPVACRPGRARPAGAPSRSACRRIRATRAGARSAAATTPDPTSAATCSAFPPGRGADVGDALPRLRVEHADDEGRGLVLHREPSLVVAGQATRARRRPAAGSPDRPGPAPLVRRPTRGAPGARAHRRVRCSPGCTGVRAPRAPRRRAPPRGRRARRARGRPMPKDRCGARPPRRPIRSVVRADRRRAGAARR